MHTTVEFFAGIVVAIGCMGIGYGLRGWIHKHLIASHEEVESWAQRLGAALTKAETDLRTEVSKIVSELRAKLP